MKVLIQKLIRLADSLDQQGCFKESNLIDSIFKQASLLFNKPIKLYYDDDADGIFSSLIFKFYSGANVISSAPVHHDFDLRRDDEDVMYVVLDARTSKGNHDLRIDHHQGGIIKDNDVIDLSAPSCAGLIANIFGAQLDSQVLQEINSLDSGSKTYFDWTNAEETSLSNVRKEAFENWEIFKESLEKLGFKELDISKIKAPGLIEEVGNARVFGNWDMPGKETDLYVNYFINIEYPKNIPFTVIGKAYSSEKPDKPYSLFIANSPSRTGIDIGNLIEVVKKKYNVNGGGRAGVGGFNIEDKEKAQQIFEEMLNLIK